MKKTHSFINLALLVEELFCFCAIGVGVYGIVASSYFWLSVVLCAVALIIAAVLFIFQYHRVIISSVGVQIHYFSATLFSKPEDIPPITVSHLWGIPLPLSTYYKLSLGILSGKRRSHVDGEILKSTRTKLALMSIGVRIDDPSDATLTTACAATSAVCRAEHKLRDKVLRKNRNQTLTFAYRARGVVVKSRPHTSYVYGYILEDAFIPLLEVNRHARSYSYKEIAKFD